MQIASRKQGHVGRDGSGGVFWEPVASSDREGPLRLIWAERLIEAEEGSSTVSGSNVQGIPVCCLAIITMNTQINA